MAVDRRRVGGAGTERTPRRCSPWPHGRCWPAWFGRTQFERNLRFDAVAAQATPQTNGVSTMQAAAEAFYRFPARWLRDPLAAIVEKELRSLARTPRYRMVFVMGFSFGLMVWLPMILGDRADRTQHSVASFPDRGLRLCADAAGAGFLLELFRLRPFGDADLLRRAAAAGPKTFAGKNVAALVFIYLEVVILVGVTSAVRRESGSRPVAGNVARGRRLLRSTCWRLGNISSVQYPRGLNPERVSQGGAASRFQALIMLLYPVSLLPVLLAYVARYAFDSELAFYLVLAFAAAVGGTLYWIAMESAVSTAMKHRERIMHDLSSNDGPIASD